MVATRVRALAGTLSLRTAEAAGTVFTVRLPVSLAIMRALLVQVDEEIYAFPAANVVEALEYDPGSNRPWGDPSLKPEAMAIRGEWLPVVRPRLSFGCCATGGETFVVVVEVDGRRSAVLVDALVGQQDIVVKLFDAPMTGARWFSGATVLGDGRPTLIVDLGSLC